MSVIPISNSPAATPPLPPDDSAAAAVMRARAAVWEVDLIDGTLHCSDDFHALLGFSPAEGRRELRRWTDRAHPDDLVRFEKALQEQRRNPAAEFEHALQMRHADGTWRWISARGRVLPGSGGRRVSGLAVDVTERYRDIEELRRTGQRYSRAIAAIRGLVYEVDLSTDRLTMHGVEKLVGGVPVEPMVTLDSWSGHIHPEDRDRLFAAIYANRERGTDYELKYRVLHADGRILHVWHRGTYLKDAVGRPQRAFGFIEDITEDVQLREELQRTERALRDSQQILATVSECSPVHLAMFDLDRRCVFVNRPLAGSRIEDVLGRRLEEFLPEPMIAVSLSYFERVVRTREDADVTDLMMFPDLPPRFYRSLLRPVLRDGEVVGVVANIEDVTESRRLQEQQQLQANIIERMQEGVMLLDREARILFTNPSLDKMFGYDPGELQGQDAMILSARARQGFEDVKRMVLEGVDAGRATVINFEGRLRDGGRRSLQGIYSGTQIGDQHCVIVVMSDMSEHKRLQRELLQVETRVQHRIGSDLHDGVGQQLAGIAMMLRALAQRAGTPAGHELRRDLQGVIDLVNSVLRSTRSMARGLAPVRADRDGLLEGFEELAQHVHDRYGVPVRLDLSLPEHMVFDENAVSNLYRIAQEGMLNAARHAQARHIQLSLTADERLAELSIVDDGKGFDPYGVGRGGMGLRVMRFRAQMLGGYLIVDSRIGHGTALRCRCPINPDKEAV